MIARDLDTVIEVDASNWTSRLDLYRSVLPCLGAPDWHSYSQDALVESMVWGEINAVEPPYTLSISGTARLPSDLLEQLRCLKEHVEEARAEHNVRLGSDVEVSVELLP